MNEQLIKVKTAILAKEKGFPQETDEYSYSYIYVWYIRDKEYRPYTLYDLSISHNAVQYDYVSVPTYDAPSQSFLQKWLREVHNNYIEVRWYSPESGEDVTKENIKFLVEVNCYGKNFDVTITDDDDFYAKGFKTYEEALEIGLQEALKLI